MTAQTPAEQALGEFRDGPDYTPTDRYPVRDVFEAGWQAAIAAVDAAREQGRREGEVAPLRAAARAARDFYGFPSGWLRDRADRIEAEAGDQ